MKIVVIFREDKQSYRAGDIFGIYNSIDEISLPRELSLSTQRIEIEEDFELYDVEINNSYWISKDSGQIVTEDPQDSENYRKGPGSYITLILNSVKVAERNEFLLKSNREYKLAKLRSSRTNLLQEVDIMVNDLALGESTATAEDIKNYRLELKNITEPYKNYSSDPAHALALDLLDVESFVWPEKP